MKIFKIIQHPLIKNVAIVVIIYFALFSNKENPHSLGSRWSLENLKKDFDDAGRRTSFIVANVAAVKGYALTKQEQKQSLDNQIASFKVIDEIEGSGEKAGCLDVASISYGIFDSKNNEVFHAFEDIIIGKKFDLFLETEVSGMRVGGFRIVKVTREFVERNDRLKTFLIKAEGNVEYRIKLEKFYKSEDPEIKCDYDPSKT